MNYDGCRRAEMALFSLIKPIFFNDLRGNHLAPKADFTGSNSVGCANDFNILDLKSTWLLPVPDNLFPSSFVSLR